MKTIYKYPLSVEDVQVVSMPVDAKVLTVQMQDNIPFLWAMVDSSFHSEDVTVRIYPTGAEISPLLSLKYCGTIQMVGGRAVFHVFVDK